MAFKSPGIYFTEIDNTEYTNPSAEINTTVAIIGFAKKGPIGEPVEITSFNAFKSIFGDPIPGTYAGLGVRSVLSAGGSVLFVRIADESLASRSRVILKNGSPAVNGALVVNNKSAITVGSMINGKLFLNGATYCSRITDNNKNKKTVILRSPAEGRFSTTEIVKQIDDCFGNMVGFSEYKFKKPSGQLGPRAFCFDVKGVENADLSIAVEENGEKRENSIANIGPYIVDLPNGISGQLVAETLNSVIAKGTTPYQIFNFSDEYGYSLKTDATSSSSGDDYNGKIQFGNNDQDGRIEYTTAYVNLPIEEKADIDWGKLTFTIKKNDSTTSSEGIQVVVDITSKIDQKNHVITLEDLADAIDTALENMNTSIRCKFIWNKTKAIANVMPALLFYGTDATDFKIMPAYRTNSKQSLFIPWFKEGSNDPVYINDYLSDGTGDNYSYLEGDFDPDEYQMLDYPFVLLPEMAVPVSYENNNQYVTVEYEPNTQVLLFKVAEDKLVKEKQVAKYTGSEVIVRNYDFGKNQMYYLFNLKQEPDIESFQSTTDKAIFEQTNKINIGYHNVSFVGEDKSDQLHVRRETDGRIFISNGDIGSSYAPPEISPDPYLYKNTLNDLFGETVTEEEFEQNKLKEGRDTVLLILGNKAAIAKSNEDAVIFEAKELGSGTTDIGIEIYTSVSPLDETDVTHYIDLYVAGTKKESWEDVSYNPDDENYFVNLINAEPDNGGSAYVTVSVKKINTSSKTVKVPDTNTLRENGIVNLGQPVGDEIDFDRSGTTDINDIYSYDYKVGNDGMPTGDQTDLFLAAMDPETSGLANKELYSWHVLITPDDKQKEDIQNAGIALCEYMEEGIYIADPPSGFSREDVIKWHNGTKQRTTPLVSNYAATYWPWVKVYNTIEQKYQYCMPSIIMAAQYCKVDNAYAPWYAPAGETNGYCSTALDLEISSKDKRYPNKLDRDALYLDQNRINPFLKLRNGKILAYGEKTCQRKNSTLTKIHTRRMLIAMKKDLGSVIKGYVFQPTMAENITKIKSNCITVMEKYKTGGGITTYNVNTDMNTTETLQQDILYVAISCVPVGCIEQVEITFTLNRSVE
jgi:hypothetical protein